MTTFTIQPSGGEQVPAGTYPNSIFQGIEEFESEKGKLLRWKFKTPDGKIATGITGSEKPTEKNRLGKFLCALGGQPLKAGTQVNPDQYLGKSYFVMVSANDKGPSVEMFALLA